jgi:hypothetical protein
MSPATLAECAEAATRIPADLQATAPGQPQPVFNFILGANSRRTPSGGKPLVALKPGQCHYPLNDPERGGEFFFCAEPIAKSGANYCNRHAKVALRTQHPTVPRGGFMGLHGAPCPQEADCHA